MHELVDTPAALERVARDLAGAERLYVDTEFESNREGKTLCLLQISRGDTEWLVDPLRLRSLAPVAECLVSAREWVLHAGLQDVELLMRDLGIPEPPALFDTQVAWALCSAEPSVSLAYLQFKLLGLRSGKAHQADDWRRRPLPAAQLRYAAQDIAHLPAMRAQLGARLRELGREEVAIEVSREQLWPEAEPPSQLSLSSFRNAWQLDHRSQAALQYLIEWHNGLSEDDRRWAPQAKVLLSLASRVPANGQDLARIKGVPARWAERHGDRLARELSRAAGAADGDGFEPIEPPPYATFEEVRLDAWLGALRAAVSAELEVAPELLLPGRVLRRLRDGYQAGGFARMLDSLDGWRGRLAREPLARWAERLAALAP